MTVFTWQGFAAPNMASGSTDQAMTAWFAPAAKCVLCGEAFERGQKVWGWNPPTNEPITAHAECVKSNTVGILKDIGECLR